MSITWNGVSSDTIGVIVERIPNRYVPTRRFSPQQVAGRNGNILLVDKAFPNVEQEYEVYLSAESQGLPSVARACAEWLMGPDGYCRLTDSYDTTVYREAFLMGGFDIENILNKFGRCTITFSCKPQKYLLTGDTPIEIPAGTTTTYTGDVVQFDVITGASITSLSATITPTQDLHGYANPWPAGGGKNKCVPDLANGQIGSNGGYSSNTSRLTNAVRVDNAYVSNTYLSAGTYTLSADGLTQCTVLTKDANANIIDNFATAWHDLPYTFTMTAAGYVFFTVRKISGDLNPDDYKAQIESGSTATSWEPYENICPISGRTGLSVYRTGKNLYSRENSEYNVPYYNQDGTQTQYEDVAVWWFKAKPNTKYTCSLKEAPSSLTYFRWINCDTDKGFISRPASVYGSNQFPITITTPADTGWVQAAVNEYNAAQVASNDWQIQIEEGQTATAYEAFGTTYAFDWTSEAGTVYGGTLDVVTGVLTVDRAQISSYAGETLPGAWISDRDAYAAGTTPTTGAQVVYELATPLTYQLTPQEVEALVGTNNVWSSSGDVSVTVTTPLGGTVTNPTPFEARPLLEVSGVGEITINGKSIQILESVSDFEIDCETMEAEDNSKIYCMDFPELSGGENEIVSDGSITALTVTPRWWTL